MADVLHLVVSPSKDVTAGLVSRLTQRRETIGGSFEAVFGKLKTRAVAVAVPKRGVDGIGETLAAFRTAHQPERFIGAGWVEAERLDQVGACLVCQDAAELPKMSDWRGVLARACPEQSAPLVIVSVAKPFDGDGLSREAAAVARPQSAASRAGALVGALWRRPAALKEVAQRKSQLWEWQEVIADAVESIVTSANESK